jgi:transcriptional regulator with XRE-family HTH domain
MPKFTLAAARKNAGLTQKQVAEELKISNTTVVKWENGSSFPKPDQIMPICKLYNMNYDDIIFFAPKNA